MSDLKDGLIHLNTLYPLTYVNMATLATSLETVQSNLQTTLRSIADNKKPQSIATVGICGLWRPTV